MKGNYSLNPRKVRVWLSQKTVEDIYIARREWLRKYKSQYGEDIPFEYFVGLCIDLGIEELMRSLFNTTDSRNKEENEK